LLATYTDGLELHHVKVNTEGGADFTIEDASNLLLDDVSSAKSTAGAPVVRLTKSPGTVLRDSRALPGTGVFLSTGAGELKGIVLSNDALKEARTPTEER
jgi:hypothetical protein